MSEPSKEQQQILSSTSRIRLVSAMPGSGKTWLISQEIQRLYSNWHDRHRGIAALSFTNTASDELKASLGFVPGHPHFIGTLDSFIFRYIVRPFGYLLSPSLHKVSLVPGDYAEALADKQRWHPNGSLSIPVGRSRTDRVNIFVASFLRDSIDGPVFLGKPNKFRPPQALDRDTCRQIFRRKQEVWARSGKVSHSDTTYIARDLLRGHAGKQILSLLERRFPVLIVDELQDTGWYLTESLTHILENSGIRALLVGDPDQSIYEFGGARPDLVAKFESLPDAEVLQINHSRRCPSKVRKVAEHLMSSSRSMEGTSREGHAILGVFDDDGFSPLRDLCKKIESLQGEYQVLTRKNSTLDRIQLAPKHKQHPFGSRPLEKFYRATVRLSQNKTRQALSLSDSGLSRVVLNTDHARPADLRKHGIDPSLWRRAAIKIIFEGLRLAEARDLYEWASQIREFVIDTLSTEGWEDIAKKNGCRKPQRPGKKIVGTALDFGMPTSHGQRLQCTTVHTAKGQTHETTIFFVPELPETQCPSKEWWEADSEERRIAYVACTRSRNALVLCVHRDVLARLRERQPEFVEEFSIKNLKDVEPYWLGDSPP